VSNTVHHLPEPFFVLATQNPVEMEGTYPLPEAQLDRFFFKILVRFPNERELAEILRRTTTTFEATVEQVATGETILQMGRLAREVPISSGVSDFVVRLVMATRPDSPRATPVVQRYVRYGASPRGAQAIVLGSKIRALTQGRLNVAFDDIRAIAIPALRHRIILNFEAESNDISGDDVLRQLLADVPESAA